MQTLVGAAVLLSLAGAAQLPPPATQPPVGQQQPAPAPPLAPEARALREIFDFALGNWELEPEAVRGLSGRFSFEIDLGGRAVLHRIVVSGAAAPGSSARANELLLVVFAEARQVKALYLDNDGKVTRFEVGFAHDSATIIFSSELVPGQQRQRLTYRPLGKDRMEVTSEASTIDGRGPLIVTSRSTWKRIK